MKLALYKLKIVVLALCAGLCFLALPVLGGGAGVAYTDFANVFTSNQRVNAGLGVNVAPGATGTVSLSSALFERSRSTALGEWISVSYNAGDYTTDTGGAVWTVDSGDMSLFKYSLIGKTMVLSLSLVTTSVSGSPVNLRVAIPGGFTSQNNIQTACGRSTDNGTTTPFRVNAPASVTYVQFARTDIAALATSTNNTQVTGTIIFEVQ